jgi:hypothetical protein
MDVLRRASSSECLYKNEYCFLDFAGRADVRYKPMGTIQRNCESADDAEYQRLAVTVDQQ